MRLSILPLFLLTACVAAEPSSDEGLAADEQEGLIFPDDAPRESCDLGTSLSCPNTTSWQMKYATSQRIGTTSTAFIVRNNAAGFSANAVNHQCTATSDYTVSGVIGYEGTVQIPNDMDYVTLPDNRGIQFVRKSDGHVQAINFLCGMSCDSRMQRLHYADGSECNPPPTDAAAHQIATIKGGGVTRDVRLAGTVDRVDRLNGQITLYCKMTLAKSQMFTAPDKRPNDVISTSGRNFRRGYEFTGNALTNACHNFANLRCTNQPGGCQATAKSECIASFSQPDPCVSVPFPQPH